MIPTCKQQPEPFTDSHQTNPHIRHLHLDVGQCWIHGKWMDPCQTCKEHTTSAALQQGRKSPMPSLTRAVYTAFNVLPKQTQEIHHEYFSVTIFSSMMCDINFYLHYSICSSQRTLVPSPLPFFASPTEGKHIHFVTYSRRMPEVCIFVGPET